MQEILDIDGVEDVRLIDGQLRVFVRRGAPFWALKRLVRSVAVKIPSWSTLAVVLAQPPGVRRFAEPTTPGLGASL